MRNSASAVVVAILSARLCLGSDLQLGLRFDSTRTMQWSGSEIYLLGEQAHLVKTSVRQIHEIWPGPIEGSFTVHSDQGLGLLLGRDIVANVRVLGESAKLRSAGPEAIFAVQASEGKAGSRFFEVHASHGGRELMVLSATPFGPLRHFDLAHPVGC